MYIHLLHLSNRSLNTKIVSFLTVLSTIKFIWILLNYFYSVVTPAPVLGKSSRWFNCHSWAAKSPVKGSVPAEWWAFLRPRRVGKKGLCSGLPTPPACFWALWKWGHSKQTIRPDEWIMMHMFTEWDFCSTFSVHSAKKKKRGTQIIKSCFNSYVVCFVQRGERILCLNYQQPQFSESLAYGWSFGHSPSII